MCRPRDRAGVERLLHVRGTVAPLDVLPALQGPTQVHLTFAARFRAQVMAVIQDLLIAHRASDVFVRCAQRTLALCAAFVVILASASAAQAQTTVTATWDPNTDTTTAGYRLY